MPAPFIFAEDLIDHPLDVTRAERID